MNKVPFAPARGVARGAVSSSARFISQRPAPLPISFAVTPKKPSSHWPASRKSSSSGPSSRPSVLEQRVDLHQRRVNDRGQFQRPAS